MSSLSKWTLQRILRANGACLDAAACALQMCEAAAR